MWLNFCSSSTLTLCIFAIEVSVSPFATTWLLPVCGAASAPRSWRHSGRRGRGRFADYHSGPDVRDLLFKFQNLLGKGVDLGVLFVDFFAQALEHSPIGLVSARGLGECRCANQGRANESENGQGEAIHGDASWH